MAPTIVTDRLVLRGIVPGDAADLFAFRSDPVEQRYNDPPLRSLAESRELVERLDRERRELGAVHWGITLAGDDRVVGLLGYNEVVAAHRRASIGYDLARRLWGRGLASEAMRAVLEHGFNVLGLHRVQAHTEAANIASIRLLHRLGFWREGTFHDHVLEDGAFHDVALFVLLAPHARGAGRAGRARARQLGGP
jgi:ribosomal-protein-alanine N-acetyltransferase